MSTIHLTPEQAKTAGWAIHNNMGDELHDDVVGLVESSDPNLEDLKQAIVALYLSAEMLGRIQGGELPVGPEVLGRLESLERTFEGYIATDRSEDFPVDTKATEHNLARVRTILDLARGGVGVMA